MRENMEDWSLQNRMYSSMQREATDQLSRYSPLSPYGMGGYRGHMGGYGLGGLGGMGSLAAMEAAALPLAAASSLGCVKLLF